MTAVIEQEPTRATGPVEYLVVAFPGNQFNGAVVPELKALVDSGTIAILDLVFIGKDGDGQVVSFEIDANDDFVDLDADVGGLISPDDVAFAAERLEPDTSAALLLWEDLWAAPFAAALRNSGGVLVTGSRIPADVIAATFETLPSAV